MASRSKGKLSRKGSAPWVVTFADLMSLLMSFFVLLLSFSQMDVQKFKRLAGSMEDAFGVQKNVITYEMPKGTSIIAKEFTPGTPEPMPTPSLYQKTMRDLFQTLYFEKGHAKQQLSETESESKSQSESNKTNQSTTAMMPDPVRDALEKAEEMAKATLAQVEENALALAQNLSELLKEEIAANQVEVEVSDMRVILRIRETAAFAEADARLKRDFVPVLDRLRHVFHHVPGNIEITGHTDNIPLHTPKFRSNWDLSAARAATIAHELLLDETLDSSRIKIIGVADTQPRYPNDSEEHRRQNGRVEITIIQHDEPVYSNTVIQALEKSIP